MLAERLRELRKKKKLTQKDIATFLGISESGYGYYEQGRNEPSLETLRKLATKYDVSVSYLTGENEVIERKAKPSNKDEKDIAKRMEEFRKDITSQDGLSFMGEPMSEEAIESLAEAMEHIFRQTQRINKKYIPKKYRDKENE
ncbi:helix-turn-helix transcriptional regulator [Mesobacillus subterraneus]|uniref:helix-turn-helix domain-containing protein n=1 Tax=Mesobacillus subterraneus TaxID=285983 RepID=UPI001CFC7E96|nr:helix-turn-helix transcriptional regulator [Mesobacillus subterraneus]WLR57773.1 helix-turn-helix transcriptional regulator [Mesobacillus subterraneus]